MNYQGYKIESVDDYSTGLPSDLKERVKNEVPIKKLYLVFDGSILIGVFFSVEDAKGFIKDLVARNLSAEQAKVEYEQYLQSLEGVVGFLIRKAFETIRAVEIDLDLDGPEPPSGPSLG